VKDWRAVVPSSPEQQIEPERIRGAQEAVARGNALPHDIGSAGILILAVLAIVYTLYFGKEILLPIALALVLKLLMQPAMRLLHERLRLPGALAALLLIIAVFGAIAAVGFTISVPASGWIQKAPESLPLLKDKLAILRQPLDYLQNGLKELENLTGPSGGDGQTVTVKQGSGLAGSLATGTATTLSRSFTTMIILFFLLASGDRLLRGFVEVLPRFKDKRTAVEIASEIEENISGYLLTITMMNALVGVATGIAMKLCGLGDPILWGAMAFLLNYIPILGPMTGVVIFFLVGIVTPMLLAKRFTLNPVLVIVSLFFWHTVWGIPGALLAVPLLAIFKIVADRIEPLKPLGHIIGS
jgi:predicted PurR-regulated permease PerM